MSINSDYFYSYKKRFEEAKENSVEERAWLLENLAKELLNDLASEWLSKEEYEREVGIVSPLTKLIELTEEAGLYDYY